MKIQAEKQGFVLYKNLWNSVKLLETPERGELFTAILQYVNGIEPELKSVTVSVLFAQVQSGLDFNQAKWDEVRLKNTVNSWKRRFLEKGMSDEEAENAARKKVYGDFPTASDRNNGYPSASDRTEIYPTASDDFRSAPVIGMDMEMGKDKVMVMDNVIDMGMGASDGIRSEETKQPDKQTFKEWLVSLCNDDQVFASAVAEWLTYQKSKQITNTKQQISILVQDLTEAYHGDGEKIRKAVHKAITGNYSRIYLPDGETSKQADEPKSADPVPAPEPEPEKPKQTLAEYLNDFLGNGQNGVEPYYQFEVKWIRGDQVCFSYWHDSVLYAKDDCINIDQATISDWPGDTEAEPEPQPEYEYGESLPFE